MSNKEKLVLCGLCGKPIHIDDWGGVSKKDGFFHADCMESFDKKMEECKFDPTRKYSKSLSEKERKLLWAVYNTQRKDFKNFEKFCSAIVRSREFFDNAFID